MMATTFWHPDGTPMSAQQFMEMLFGKLPEFFDDGAGGQMGRVPERFHRELKKFFAKGETNVQ